MNLDFGVIDHLDFQAIPIHQTFDERVEQIVQYDRDGFHAYHLTEHHFTPHGLASSPLAFLSAVSRLTKRIKLVPTVLVLPTYHPLRLAEEICMLDQLSHGRFEFGTGKGVVPHELALFGINPPIAGDMAKEVAEILMKALDNDSVTHRGKYYDFYDVPMILRPYKPFADRGSWIVSGRPEAARDAGRKGDNVLSIMNPAKLKPLVDSYLDGWAETHGPGAPTSKIGLTRHVFVAESQDEAVARGEFGFAGWFANHSWMWNRFDHSRGAGDDAPYRAHKAMIFGTPDYVKAELKAQLEEAGGNINYVAPRFAFGNLSQEEVMRSYALFRDEVMPAFRDNAASSQLAA
ncbi:Limonene 1,2-monooxygenase (plasmid) [Sphingobium sp. AntQ-1]|uniref:LLM class flavin-dependent oxidoreductase n=1 Tax=Sphingobium sp. AntQ-1 TaxID=2930091 RepID=UPI00234F67B3|nr:LLM class flavin-dependent oxidoreductase [Sphingobium sp. AntQ-1]WCP16256.1 Limonene 1,2-monooxygenase [Sphingobium sp. AntQ-1]